ncbi:retrovirus-related pol polyprotein from transposon TNT 1-94 [Tanacetum coccineum]|uniref:Retrovirus-related pol polyprotein from transposon TNT 1-94 n=1 Tax=Tanacetum coccineum TaxID=301880 RepID=A0ABQ5ANG6_9ASTR
MDLCGLMRIESINEKKYILIIVDDYSRFTWVKFLRSKDETLEFVIKFLKMIQVRLNATVRNIRMDNGTKFVNQTLKTYYEDVGIAHQTSVAPTPQQNDIVERRNQTLVEATRATLIFSKAPLKPDLKYFHVFGALCYPTNDSEDLGKLKTKVDIGIFIGYSPVKKAYQIYNRRTRLIMETIHGDFDELTAMASKQFGSGPEHKLMTLGTISLRLEQTHSSPILYVPRSKKDWDILYRPMFDEYFQPSPKVVSQLLPVVAPIPDNTTGTPSSTFIDQNAPTASTSPTSTETLSPIISKGVEEYQPTHLLNQALEILKKYGMEFSDLVDTPMVKRTKLDEDLQGTPVHPTRYRGMIGSLMYLTSSILYLVFAVCMCARYQAKPTEKHLQAVKQIFRYLRGTLNT